MAVTRRLSDSQIASLVAEHPALPPDYLAYLREVGWGMSSSGHMIYGGPISPKEVYPQLREDGRVLIGDDTQGYCLGYDFTSKSFGEYSPRGEWTSFDASFDLARRLDRND